MIQMRVMKKYLVLAIPLIYVMVDRIMLASMVSVQAASYFNQSDKIVQFFLAIITVTGLVAFSYPENAVANNQLYKAFQFGTTLAIPVTLGLIALAPRLVPLFLTNKFIDVIPIMMIEAFVILLGVWSNVLILQYLLPSKRLKDLAISLAIGGIINFLVNLPLIAAYGVIGSALATVVAEFFVVGYQLVILRTKISYQRLFSGFGRCLISGVGMFTAIYLLEDWLTKDWLPLVIETFAGIGVYLWLLKNIKGS